MIQHKTPTDESLSGSFLLSVRMNTHSVPVCQLALVAEQSCCYANPPKRFVSSLTGEAICACYRVASTYPTNSLFHPLRRTGRASRRAGHPHR